MSNFHSGSAHPARLIKIHNNEWKQIIRAPKINRNTGQGKTKFTCSYGK